METKTKICRDCCESFPITSFPTAGFQKGVEYYKPYCKNCRNLLILRKKIVLKPHMYMEGKKVHFYEYKICNICKIDKVTTDFPMSIIKGVRMRKCNQCISEAETKRLRTTKVCTKCGIEHPLSYFGNYRSKRTGIIFKRPRCKDCPDDFKSYPSYKTKGNYKPEYWKSHKKWRENNPDAWKACYKRWTLKAKGELKDSYIKSLLNDGKDILRAKDCSPELIDLKRKEVLLKRKIENHDKEKDKNSDNN